MAFDAKEMKGLSPFLVVLAFASCDRAGEVSAPEAAEEELPWKPTITYCGEQMSLETWKGRIAEEQNVRRKELAEMDRIGNLPPFENALESEGSNTVARAFIVEKAENGEVSVLGGLIGRIPSDPEQYIIESKSSGQYLVGSLMPRGGHGIHASNRKEERFSLALTEGGKFLHGEGVSGLLWIEDVKEKLTLTANKMEQSDR